MEADKPKNNIWPDPCFHCGKYPLVYAGKIHCVCSPPDTLDFVAYGLNIVEVITAWNNAMEYARKYYRPESKEAGKL